MTSATRDAQHETLNDELNAYLDGQLDPARRAGVERHLETCTLCQSDLEELRVTRAAFRAQPLLRAPRPFVIPAEEARPSRWLGFFAWGWRLGSAASAACLVLTVLSSGATPGAGGGSTASVAMKAEQADTSALRSGTAVPERQAAGQTSGQAAGQAAPAAPAAAPAPASRAADQASGELTGLLAAQPTRPVATSAPTPTLRTAPTPAAREAPRPTSGVLTSAWAAAALALGAGSAVLFALERRARTT